MEQDAPPLTRARQAPPSGLRVLRLIHPFPTLLNVAATAALAFVATDGSPDASVLVRMLLAMFCVQAAIGATNDLFDRELDAATKPWKPLVSGAVSPSISVAVIAMLIITSVVLGATLGAGSFVLLMLGLACGLAYDVRLKRTPWSALPFMVAIPTLPAWVWVTTGEWERDLWWIVPIGALAGLSLHLANTLPDLHADARHGIRGLAHRLGARRAAAVAWSSFALALALTLALGPLLDYDPSVYAPAALVGVACLAASVLLFALKRDDAALQFGFGAIAAGTVIVAAGWLGAMT